MLFTNFTGEGAESLKSKYHEVATSNKGQGLSFLLGDAENSQGAFQVSLSRLSIPQLFHPCRLQNAKKISLFSEPITVLWTRREPSSSHHHPNCWRQEIPENKCGAWPDWIMGQGLQGWKSCPTQKISTYPNREQRASEGCCCWEPWRCGLQLWKERWVT